jgi:L-serine dehydratase
MGPTRAATTFLSRFPVAAKYEVTLFASLAATGRGHLTDAALNSVFDARDFTIIWKPEIELPLHPNGMLFKAFDENGKVIGEWQVYSIGGGSVSETGDKTAHNVYKHQTMDDLLRYCEDNGLSFWEYVISQEGIEIMDYVGEVWKVMVDAIERGLNDEGVLPGGLGIPRKANAIVRKIRRATPVYRRGMMLSAYALAVSEENASGNLIVTAPTCGACGVIPAVMKFCVNQMESTEIEVHRALLTAGLIGNLVKQNGSISGAEVGCQGEVGTACAMASAAVTQILGGTPRQIEYAAEMGLEHHLGLTCDPVMGLVQIPCIERNVFAAKQAMSCAEYALFSDGGHRITFDEVVSVMTQTGKDLSPSYRETSIGGLADAYARRVRKTNERNQS